MSVCFNQCLVRIKGFFSMEYYKWNEHVKCYCPYASDIDVFIIDVSKTVLVCKLYERNVKCKNMVQSYTHFLIAD